MCDWLYILHYARAWFPIPGAHHCEGGVESGGESSQSMLLSGHAALPAVRTVGHSRNRTLSTREYLGLRYVWPHQSQMMETESVKCK